MNRRVRKRVPWRASLALLCLISSSCLAQDGNLAPNPGAQNDNLAPNPGFEEVATDCAGPWLGGCPVGYATLQETGAATAQLITRHGDRILQIRGGDGSAPGGFAAGAQFFTQRVTPGATYLLSVSVRTDSLLANTRVVAEARDEEKNILEKVVAYGPRETSVWQRLSLAIPIPAGANELAVSLGLEGQNGNCGSDGCGTGYFDDVSLVMAQQAQTVDLQHPLSNVCPEGAFIDLANTENECKPLVVDLSELGAAVRKGLSSILTNEDKVFGEPEDNTLGFKWKAFEAAFAPYAGNAFSLEECTRPALQKVLDQIERAGGGSLSLPACEIEVDKTITIPSNVIVRGAGIGRTRLYPALGFTRKVSDSQIFLIRGQRNVVVQDLSIDHIAKNEKKTGLFSFFVTQSDNILLDRVAASNGVRVGFRVDYSTNYTLRNSVSYGFDTKSFTSGDCGIAGKKTPEKCEKIAGQSGVELEEAGSYWSASYAIYSNLFRDAGNRVFDSHAWLGEIAGNQMSNAPRGPKFPDARYIWFHHNLVSHVQQEAFKTQSDGVIGHEPRYFVVFSNRFQDNGKAKNGNFIRFGDTAYVYLSDNQYVNNRGRIALHGGQNAYLCGLANGASKASQMENKVQNIQELPATSAACQLDAPGMIFNE